MKALNNSKFVTFAVLSFTWLVIFISYSSYRDGVLGIKVSEVSNDFDNCIIEESLVNHVEGLSPEILEGDSCKKWPLLLFAESVTREYGSLNDSVSLTFSFDGFKNMEWGLESVAGWESLNPDNSYYLRSYSLADGEIEYGHFFDITLSGGTDTNYELHTLTGTLEIKSFQKANSTFDRIKNDIYANNAAEVSPKFKNASTSSENQTEFWHRVWIATTLHFSIVCGIFVSFLVNLLTKNINAQMDRVLFGKLKKMLFSARFWRALILSTIVLAFYMIPVELVGYSTLFVYVTFFSGYFWEHTLSHVEKNYKSWFERFSKKSFEMLEDNDSKV